MHPVSRRPALIDGDVASSLLALRQPQSPPPLPRLPSLALFPTLRAALIAPALPPPAMPTASDLRAIQSDPRVRQALERLKEHHKTYPSDLSVLSRETVALIASMASSTKRRRVLEDGDDGTASTASSSHVQSTDGSMGDETPTGKRRRLDRRGKGVDERAVPLEAPVKTSFPTSWAQRKHNFELVQLKRDIERCRKEYLSYLRGRLGRCIATNGQRQLPHDHDFAGRRVEIRVASMAYLFQSRALYPCGVGAFNPIHTLRHNVFADSICDVAALFRASAACVRVDHSTIEACRPLGPDAMAFDTVFWVTVTDVAGLQGLLKEGVRVPGLEVRGQLRVKAVLTCVYKTFDVTDIDVAVDIADALQSYKPPEVRAETPPPLAVVKGPVLRPMPPSIPVPSHGFFAVRP
ncbi:hypothetical protein ACHHYP_15073 [Achlya hypogyna]|uniref:Uncharacterized protein n=1 Tax=Achlya hypogyna TaxID=1202772 RepID=A0A1V9YBJ4_ACHHY|nr:hypothetical protein ACHHYP_15073 [Achlya hypogyna]